MKFKEILAKHGVENAELLTELNSALDSENSIPKTRFDEVIRQRNEAKADLSEKDSEIATLKTANETLQNSNSDLNSYKTKWETTENQRNNDYKTKWEEKSKIFSIDETDKRFEQIGKVKDSFVFAEEGKALTVDQINKNMANYSLFEKTGIFGEAEANPDLDKGKFKKEGRNVPNKSESIWGNAMKKK